MPLQIDTIEPTSARLQATENLHVQAVRGSWLAQINQHHLEPPSGPLTAQITYQAGQNLARIHTLGQQFPLPLDNPWPLSNLTELLSQIDSKQLGSDSQRHTLGQQLNYLADRPPYDLPLGMTHGDFAPEPLLANMAMCAETLVYDLAIALNAYGFDASGMYRASWFHGLLSGYEAVRSLRRDERRLFNYELRRAAVRNCILLLLAQSHLVDVGFEILHTHTTRHEMASYS